MIIAYLRISTEKQVIENQKNEIGNFAREKGLEISQWYMETVSGTCQKESRKLETVLRRLRANDVLIVSEISRLSRTMLEIMSILNICINKKIILYSVKEGYAIENNMSSKIIGFAFGMAAEIERNLIAARTREALAQRKASGIVLGRPKGSFPQKQVLMNNKTEIYSMIREGVPKIKIAAMYKVSRMTFYTFLKENAMETQAPVG